MDLAEYTKDNDINKFWKLPCGVVDNLLDEAITRIRELEADNEQRRLDYTNSVNELDARIRELKAQLAAAQERERWIPVEEMMPGKTDNYLAFGRYFESAHELYFNGTVWKDEAGEEVKDILYWRKLPNPPEAKDE